MQCKADTTYGAFVWQSGIFLEKLLQLHKMLKSVGSEASVLLVGPSGCGKSILRSLCIEQLMAGFDAECEQKPAKGLWRRMGETARSLREAHGSSDLPKTTVLTMVRRVLKSKGVAGHSPLPIHSEADGQVAASSQQEEIQDLAYLCEHRSTKTRGPRGPAATSQPPSLDEEEGEGFASSQSQVQVIFPQAVGLGELFGSFARIEQTSEGTKVGLKQAATEMEDALRTSLAERRSREAAVSVRRHAISSGVELDQFRDGVKFGPQREGALNQGDEDQVDSSEEECEGTLHFSHDDAELGDFVARDSRWKDGMLTSLLRNFNGLDAISSVVGASTKERTWLVLDSDLYGDWMESLVGIFMQRTLMLANGESLKVPANLTVIVEAQSTAMASPSLLANCAILELGENAIGWKPLLRNWVKQWAHDLMRNDVRELQRWTEIAVEATVNSMRKESLTSTTTSSCFSEQRLMGKMLELLSSLLR